MVIPISFNIIFLPQVYIVLQDIESINKTEKQHYEHRFLLTVDMMYRKLAKALHETNIQGIHFNVLPYFFTAYANKFRPCFTRH